MSIAACLAAGTLAATTPATIAAVPVAQLHGRGARVGFTEYEAESGCYMGTEIGPSRALYTIAAEASGRRAVRLDRRGQYVEFTLARPANAVTVRYAIPDSADGSGLDSTLGIYVRGERLASLPLTSRYSWFYGRYPFTNRPSDGGGHHMFDEARVLLGRTLPAGSKVRLAVGPQDAAAWYVIDLADFEQVAPPLVRPAGSLSVAAFGADPSGREESSRAFAAAIAAARDRHAPLWIGPGTYRIDRHLTVDRITILGAGSWYSILRGRGVGLYGRNAPHGPTAVHLSDFAIIGEVRERNDRAKLAAIGGALGGGAVIQRLWLQHNKSGVWLDGPLSGVSIRDLRIVDNTADGINLRRGVRGARIENVFVRNSGDDGIALWSHRSADNGITVSHNTVVAPILANGIAVYGGRDIRISDNLVADTLTQGGGIHLGNRFGAVPLAGTIRLERNQLVRTGSFDPNWRFGVGALWFYALDGPIGAAIKVSETEIVDSTLEAIQFIGKPIRSVRFSGTLIDGASNWLQLQSGGQASFSGLQVRRLDDPTYAGCDESFSLTLDRVPGEFRKASTRLCGPLNPRMVERLLEQ